VDRARSALAVLLAAALVAGMGAGWRAARSSAEGNALPPGRHVELVQGRCVICHGLDIVAQQRLDRSGWAAIVDRMIVYGAPIAPEEREPILEYLVTHLGG
jgi:hypothetical protein